MYIDYLDFMPTLEDIKSQVDKIVELTKDLHTYDDIEKFVNDYPCDLDWWIEINGEPLDEFNPDVPIEYIRINYHDDLSYIYVFWEDDEHPTKKYMFDIFCGDDYVDYLATDITPDDLTEENYYHWVEEYKEKRGLT